MRVLLRFIASILARGAIARLFLAFITRNARVRATRAATYRSLDLCDSHFFSFHAWLCHANFYVLMSKFRGSKNSKFGFEGLSEETTCSYSVPHILSLEIQVQTLSRTFTQLSHYVANAFVSVVKRQRYARNFSANKLFPRIKSVKSHSCMLSYEKLQVHFNCSLFTMFLIWQ